MEALTNYDMAVGRADGKAILPDEQLALFA